MSYFVNPGIGNPRFPYKSFFTSIGNNVAPNQYVYSQKTNGLFTLRTYNDITNSVFADFDAIGVGSPSSTNYRWFANYAQTNSLLILSLSAIGDPSDPNNVILDLRGTFKTPIIYTREIRDYDHYDTTAGRIKLDDTRLLMNFQKYVYVGSSTDPTDAQYLNYKFVVDGDNFVGGKSIMLGPVGIGTTAPIAKLDVVGSAYVRNYVVTPSVTDASNTVAMTFLGGDINFTLNRDTSVFVDTVGKGLYVGNYVGDLTKSTRFQFDPNYLIMNVGNTETAEFYNDRAVFETNVLVDNHRVQSNVYLSANNTGFTASPSNMLGYVGGTEIYDFLQTRCEFNTSVIVDNGRVQSNIYLSGNNTGFVVTNNGMEGFTNNFNTFEFAELYFYLRNDLITLPAAIAADRETMTIYNKRYIELKIETSDLNFYMTNTPAKFFSFNIDGNEKLLIRGDYMLLEGKVGINKIPGDFDLDVAGNVNISGNFITNGDVNINSNLIANGDVNFSSDLNVSGNVNIIGELIANKITSESGFVGNYLYHPGQQTGIILTGTEMVFYVGNQAKQLINSTGVGIGTEPQYNLDIVGTTRSTQLRTAGSLPATNGYLLLNDIRIYNGIKNTGFELGTELFLFINNIPSYRHRVSSFEFYANGNPAVAGTQNSVTLSINSLPRLEVFNTFTRITGNLGVNVNFPTLALEVDGTAKVSNLIVDFNMTVSNINSTNFIASSNVDTVDAYVSGDLTAFTIDALTTVTSAQFVTKSSAFGNLTIDGVTISNPTYGVGIVYGSSFLFIVNNTPTYLHDVNEFTFYAKNSPAIRGTDTSITFTTLGSPRFKILTLFSRLDLNLGIKRDPSYELDVNGRIRADDILLGPSNVSVLDAISNINTSGEITCSNLTATGKITTNILQAQLISSASGVIVCLQLVAGSDIKTQAVRDDYFNSGFDINNLTGNYEFYHTSTKEAEMDSNGNFYATGFITTSDRRLKENIVSLDDDTSFEIIKNVNPVKYIFKKDKTKERYGFIAQELENVCPLMVTTGSGSVKFETECEVIKEGERYFIRRCEEMMDYTLGNKLYIKDSKSAVIEEVVEDKIYVEPREESTIKLSGVEVQDLKSINYENMIPVLVSAVQSLTSQVEKLTARIAELENMSSK